MQVGGRRALLALVVTAHVLALLLWPQRDGLPRGAPHGEPREALALVFVPLPPLRELQHEEPPRAGKPVAVVRVRPRSVPESPAMVLLAPAAAAAATPAIADPPQSMPAPAAASAAADIRAAALAAAGSIDRQLRKVSLNSRERTLAYQPPAIERALAGARVAPPVQEELTMADGRRMTRIGKNCAYKESNALTRGRDVIQQGVRTIWAECAPAR